MLKYQVVKFLIDTQTRDLLDNSHKNLDKQAFASSQAVKDYHLDPANKPLIDFSPKMKKEREELQKLLFDKLYRHYRVVRMTEKAKRVIGQIFEVYLANPDQLPYDIWPRKQKATETEKYQAICNYIAGMTDRFALDEHKKLFDPFKKV